jgi:uncharacterized protein DUF5666
LKFAACVEPSVSLMRRQEPLNGVFAPVVDGMPLMRPRPPASTAPIAPHARRRNYYPARDRSWRSDPRPSQGHRHERSPRSGGAGAERSRRRQSQGVVSGLSGTCPDITFTLNSVTVKANGATRYERASCAQLRNTIRLEVHGQRQTDSSVLATRIKRTTQDAPACKRQPWAIQFVNVSPL